MSSGKNEYEVPISEKLMLTVQECSALSGIGQNTIEDMLNMPRCPFLFKNGRRRLILRKEFEKYITENRVINVISDKGFRNNTDTFHLTASDFDEKWMALVPDNNDDTDVAVSNIISHVNFDTCDDKIISDYSGDITKSGADGAYVVKTTPSNMVVIGNPRSGISHKFSIPTVNIWSRMKNRPNIIVVDCKGETYTHTKAILEKRGYEVLKIQPDRPDNSVGYNPLSPVVRHARNGSMEEAVSELTELASRIYPIDEDYNKTWKSIGDPVCLSFANSAFRFGVLLLLNECIMEEKSITDRREITEEELDGIWSKFTLYGCSSFLMHFIAKCDTDSMIEKAVCEIKNEQLRNYAVNVSTLLKLGQVFSGKFKSSLSVMFEIFGDPNMKGMTSVSPLQEIEIESGKPKAVFCIFRGHRFTDRLNVTDMFFTFINDMFSRIRSCLKSNPVTVRDTKYLIMNFDSIFTDDIRFMKLETMMSIGLAMHQQFTITTNSCANITGDRFIDNVDMLILTNLNADRNEIKNAFDIDDGETEGMILTTRIMHADINESIYLSKTDGTILINSNDTELPGACYVVDYDENDVLEAEAEIEPR